VDLFLLNRVTDVILVRGQSSLQPVTAAATRSRTRSTGRTLIPTMSSAMRSEFATIQEKSQSDQ
jgi:hypothetical protein